MEQENKTKRIPLSIARCRVGAGENTEDKSPLLWCCKEASYITVQSGGVTVYTDGKAYHLATGDSLILDPYTLYRTIPSPETGVDYLALRMDPSLLVDREMAAGLENGTLATYPLWKRSGSGGVLVAGCLRAAYFSCEGGKNGWEFAALGQMSMLYAHLAAIGAITPRKKQSRTSDFSRRTLAYIEAHYAEPITSREAAASLPLHPSDFCRRFRAAFGTTFSLYLSAWRIEKARELLKTTDLPISEIVSAVGFADFSYFSKTFRERLGCTPTAYRKK